MERAYFIVLAKHVMRQHMISISASSAQMTAKEHLSYSSGLKSGADCREYLILLTVERSYTQIECSTDNTSVYCSV